MPIKFSELETLETENLKEETRIVGLDPDNSSEIKYNNCLIKANYFAKKSDLTTLETTVNTKAEDSDVVHKTGNETITGDKSITGKIVLKTANQTVHNNSLYGEMAQQGNSYFDLIGLYDTTNNCRCATIRAYNKPDQHGILLAAHNFNNGSPNGIEVSYDNSNNLTATAPTPTAGDNSTKIATTAWVNDATKSTNVVHRDGSETITGNKTFSGTVSLGSNATAKTQTLTDNSTKIATTAFVQSSIPASINKFFGKTRPTFHKLYENPSGLGSGDISLSEEFTNFDMILIIIGDDDGGEELCCEWMPTWLLKYLMNYASKDVLFRGGPNYWRIKSKNKGGSYINFIDAGENSRIYQIIGINMDGS